MDRYTCPHCFQWSGPKQELGCHLDSCVKLPWRDKEIVELRADLAECQRSLDEANARANVNWEAARELTNKFFAAEREIEQLRADARRWRWLCTADVPTRERIIWSSDTMDAAIDAALEDRGHE